MNSVARTSWAGKTALVSGFGAGSEMLAAREFGFGRIVGVEVDPLWVSVCRRRVLHLDGMTVTSYEGNHLPFSDGQFDAVASGHIIEHTADPALYFRECLRVLAPGGFLSFEFPTRYSRRELHTGLPSFEWLPRLIRNGIPRQLAGRHSPLRTEVRTGYESIVATALRQISFGWVRRAAHRSPFPGMVIAHPTPQRGVVRCVVRRLSRTLKATG